MAGSAAVALAASFSASVWRAAASVASMRGLHSANSFSKPALLDLACEYVLSSTRLLSRLRICSRSRIAFLPTMLTSTTAFSTRVAQSCALVPTPAAASPPLRSDSSEPNGSNGLDPTVRNGLYGSIEWRFFLLSPASSSPASAEAPDPAPTTSDCERGTFPAAVASLSSSSSGTRMDGSIDFTGCSTGPPSKPLQSSSPRRSLPTFRIPVWGALSSWRSSCIRRRSSWSLRSPSASYSSPVSGFTIGL
mmetsp:Transcript_19323/g.54258  ORF Transcript_19323/g.54258 Transcript_19323/m.54258 type:complete len:249 (+) Transcript_19323:904-1650(+)